MALWRSPKENAIHLLCGQERPVSYSDFSLEDLNDGYLVAPFGPSKESPVIFVSTAYHLKCSNEELIVEDPNGDLPIEQIVKEKTVSGFQCHPGTVGTNVFESDKSQFMSYVQEALDAIERDDFEKVVTARSLKLPVSKRDGILEFLTLSEKYPNAFVCLFTSTFYGTWLGVSPELLVSVSRDQVFHTMSLAGTQPIKGYVDVKEAKWSQKEIEEQAMVSRYIVEQFKKIRLREFIEKGPRTVSAGNLIHLQTDYTVDMKKTERPDLGTVMLKLLHPTSAVCGMPMEKALDFIIKNEKMNRSLYSGYWGPVYKDGSCQLFVNIRCFRFFLESIQIYAGAGITHDSDPEKEWFETEAKINTIRSVIGGLI
jgi:isochorismate synthase